MSRWIMIEKSGVEVKVENGATLKVGQLVKMGLGSIELRNTPKAGLHVVRLSARGHFKYCVELRKDGKYRLGAHRGHRVVEVAEEVDPIKRILRLMDIPVTCLMQATEPTLEVCERWYDNSHCPNGRPTNRWIHDGQRTEVDSKQLESPQGFFGGGGHRTADIKGASWAICINSGRYMNGCNWTRPGTVVVWPNCEPAKLAVVLIPLVYGTGADLDYILALKNQDAARHWIATNFEAPSCPRNFTWEGDLVIFRRKSDGVEDGFTILTGDHRSTGSMQAWPGLIAKLVSRHGFSVVDLPDKAKGRLATLEQ